MGEFPPAYQLPDPLAYQDCKEEDIVEHQLIGTWMKKTGWDAYVFNLESDGEIAGILRLIEALFHTYLNLTSRAERIEKELFYVYEFAVDYLKNCKDYLDHKDALVRQAIFAGRVASFLDEVAFSKPVHIGASTKSPSIKACSCEC